MQLTYRTSDFNKWGSGKESGLTNAEIDTNFYEIETDSVKKSDTGLQTIEGSLTVGVNLTVNGDLIVQGTNTVLNTNTLATEDKNITLNAVTDSGVPLPSPPGTGLDGGITLFGAPAEIAPPWQQSNAFASLTLKRSNNLPQLNDPLDVFWESNISFNVRRQSSDTFTKPRGYWIDDSPVLYENKLGDTITQSNLSKVGNITQGMWNGWPIPATSGGIGFDANIKTPGSIFLTPSTNDNQQLQVLESPTTDTITIQGPVGAYEARYTIKYFNDGSHNIPTLSPDLASDSGRLQGLVPTISPIESSPGSGNYSSIVARNTLGHIAATQFVALDPLSGQPGRLYGNLEGGINYSGQTHLPDTGVGANTVVLRDSQGSITATNYFTGPFGKFNGNLLGGIIYYDSAEITLMPNKASSAYSLVVRDTNANIYGNEFFGSTFNGNLNGNASFASNATYAGYTEAVNDTATNQYRYASSNSGANSIAVRDANDTINAGNFNSTSDITLKKDLEKIEGALGKVKQLTGYTYTLIETNQRSTGLIAQDALKVLPESVSEKDGKLSLAYGSMMGLIVEAIKELDEKLEDIRNLISNK